MNKVMIAVAAAVLTGCAGTNRSLSKGAVRDIWAQASDKEYIRVRGIGVPPETAKGETEKKGLAREAALVQARYELLALLRGVKITGGLNVAALMEKDGHIREIANAVILSAEEVQTEWATDGGCIVLVEIKRDKVEKMLAQASAADTSDAYRASLDQQVEQSDARQASLKSKLPGVSVQ